MSFDSGKASVEQLEARIQKFKRLAPKMNAEHFQKVLESFPADSRGAVVLAVKGDGPADFFRPKTAEPVFYREANLIPQALANISDGLKNIKGSE